MSTPTPARRRAGSRADSILALESEVLVLIRRVRRVIGDRSRMVHPELQPAAYLLLISLAESGPVRSSSFVEKLEVDKGAVSRQIQHLVDLGLAERSPDPDDGRATLVSASADAARRLSEVSTARRGWLDERLGDWSDAELTDFVATLGRYNASLGD